MDSIGKSLGQNVGQMWRQYRTSSNAPKGGSAEVSSKMFISSRQNRHGASPMGGPRLSLDGYDLLKISSSCISHCLVVVSA